MSLGFRRFSRRGDFVPQTYYWIAQLKSLEPGPVSMRPAGSTFFGIDNRHSVRFPEVEPRCLGLRSYRCCPRAHCRVHASLPAKPCNLHEACLRLVASKNQEWNGRTQFLHGCGRVLTGSFDQTIRLWQADSGRELLVLKAAGNSGTAFSPDGRRIVGVVAVGTNWSARIWEAASAGQVAAWQEEDRVAER